MLGTMFLLGLVYAVLIAVLFAAGAGGVLLIVVGGGLFLIQIFASDKIALRTMGAREVSAQVDTGAQDKQMQLGLLGSSDAVFQQRNRELGIVEGELSRLEQDLQQAKFHLLQLESTVARLRG